MALLDGGCRELVAEEREPHVQGPHTAAVLRRTPLLSMYPCVEQCHGEREPNPVERTLVEFHTLRTIRHGDSMHWCPFCHQIENRNQLRLLDATAVSFDQAYLLCGQCHGEKYRDWRAGVHGLTSGSWDGLMTLRSCPACHDPHLPRRPTFDALPPPRGPNERLGAGAGQDGHG